MKTWSTLCVFPRIIFLTTCLNFKVFSHCNLFVIMSDSLQVPQCFMLNLWAQSWSWILSSPHLQEHSSWSHLGLLALSAWCSVPPSPSKTHLCSFKLFPSELNAISILDCFSCDSFHLHFDVQSSRALHLHLFHLHMIVFWIKILNLRTALPGGVFGMWVKRRQRKWPGFGRNY